MGIGFFSKCRATGRFNVWVKLQQVEGSHKKHKEQVTLLMVFIFSPIQTALDGKGPMFKYSVATDFPLSAVGSYKHNFF
jgi:hypothetical protein